MKYLTFIFISFLLISCSNKNENIAKKIKSPNHKNSINKIQKNIPPWILNPNLGVKYGAVGIAPYQKNKKLQRLKAIANAKRKISQQFREQIQKQTPPSFGTNSKLIGSTFNIVTLQSSQNITKNLTIKASYTDPKTKTLYIWLVIY